MERQQVGQRARASAAFLNCQWPIRTTVPCASITTNPLLGASRDMVGGSKKAQTVETAQGLSTLPVRCQPNDYGRQILRRTCNACRPVQTLT